MLKSLRAAKEDPNCAAPRKERFHEETKERTEERIFAHLSPNEIELTIVGCKALDLLGHANMCAYVYGEFQIGDNSAQKFKTSYVTSPSPNFNYVTKFLFDRSKKTHCRFFELRRTMVLHVAHKKTIGSVDIGVFEVKFSDLLTSSESKQTIPIASEYSHKPLVSATAEVILRVHEPITHKEYLITTEKELVLDEPIPETSSHAHETTTEQPQGKSAVSQVASQSTMVYSTTTPSTVPAPTAMAPAASSEEELDPVDRLDRVCSYEVLKWEEERCKAYAENGHDVIVRSALIKASSALLSLKVSNGSLCPDVYKEQLENAVTVEQNIANTLLAAGKKEQAQVPLKRVSIMKKEIKDIEGGDEEEEFWLIP
ncbi:hypothetical protein Pelo_3145 [Pelomyxa schiedti]|nr:hypothetical protein Pelo_3145 [Pelomyxa schiedti]